MPKSSSWRSFWDLATPEQGAAAVLQMYGDAAAEAASHCASAAFDDNREDDYRFWTAVLARVRVAGRRRRKIARRFQVATRN
jgi:hypothetical protein